MNLSLGQANYKRQIEINWLFSSSNEHCNWDSRMHKGLDEINNVWKEKLNGSKGGALYQSWIISKSCYLCPNIVSHIEENEAL